MRKSILYPKYLGDLCNQILHIHTGQFFKRMYMYVTSFKMTDIGQSVFSDTIFDQNTCI